MIEVLTRCHSCCLHPGSDCNTNACPKWRQRKTPSLFNAGAITETNKSSVFDNLLCILLLSGLNMFWNLAPSASKRCTAEVKTSFFISSAGNVCRNMRDAVSCSNCCSWNGDVMLLVLDIVRLLYVCFTHGCFSS